MRRFVWVIPFVAASFAVASSQVRADSAPASKQTDGRVSGAGLTSLFRTIFGGNAAGGLGEADKLLTAGNLTQAESANVRALRGGALLALGRVEAAREEFARADAEDPTDPAALRIQFMSGYASKDRGTAAAALDRLIDRFPDAVRELPVPLVESYLHLAEFHTDQKMDDQRIALARIGYGGSEGDVLKLMAATLLVERADALTAEDLIGSVRDPNAARYALIDRRLSAVWPLLERHAGPRMENMARAFVETAKADVAESPHDPRTLDCLLKAYERAGDLKSAIAIGSNFATSPAELAALDEQGGWLVNSHANVLFRAGRYDEADRRLAQLIAANSGPWIVNMAVNRVEMLQGRGEFPEALRQMGVAERAAQRGTEYARQFVRRSRMCALYKVGKFQEAKALRTEVLANAASAFSPTLEGLLCIKDIDGAEAVALQGLANPSQRVPVLAELQMPPLDNFNPIDFSKELAELRSRPKVAAAFEAEGRDLPVSLRSRRASGR